MFSDAVESIIDGFRYGNRFRLIAGAIVVALAIKWGLLLFSSHADNMADVAGTNHTQMLTNSPAATIDYAVLLPKAEYELQNMNDDIEAFTNEQLGLIEEDMLAGLAEEDGFLDWLYGWGTGYQMVWYKTKDFVLDGNELNALVEEKFRQMVIEKGDIDTRIALINDFAERRRREFYVTVMNMVVRHTEKIQTERDLPLQKIESDQIPWGKYMAGRISDAMSAGILATTLTGKRMPIGKVVGDRIAAIATAKIATIAGSKVAGIVLETVTFGVGIAVDYLLNEGYEAINREDDEKRYGQTIHAMVYNRIGESLNAAHLEQTRAIHADIVAQLRVKRVIK